MKNGVGNEGLNGGYSNGSYDSVGYGVAGPPVYDMSASSYGTCGPARDPSHYRVSMLGHRNMIGKPDMS